MPTEIEDSISEVNDKVYAYYFLETKLPNNQNFLVNLQFSRWDK